MMKLIKSIILASTLFVSAQSQAVLMMWLDPGYQVATTGDPVTVSLMVGGLGDLAAPSLGAFDVDVNFDPSVLSFTGYSFFGGLGDIGAGEALDFSLGDLGGAVALSELSLLAPAALNGIQSDMFKLADLFFTVDDLEVPDFTDLTITPYAISDGLGSDITTSFTFDGARIGTLAVSEPGMVLLMALGLVGLFSRRQSFF